MPVDNRDEMSPNSVEGTITTTHSAVVDFSDPIARATQSTSVPLYGGSPVRLEDFLQQMFDGKWKAGVTTISVQQARSCWQTSRLTGHRDFGLPYGGGNQSEEATGLTNEDCLYHRVH